MDTEYSLNRLIEEGRDYEYEVPRDEWDTEYRIYDTESKLQRMGRMHLKDKELIDQIFSGAMDYLTGTEALSYKEAQTNPVKQNEMMALAKSYISKFPELTQHENDVNVMLKRLNNALFHGYVIQPLIDAPEISDIKITGPDDIRVRISGKAYLSNAQFLNERDMTNFIKSIGLRNYKDITERPFTRFVDKFDANYRLRFSITMPRILQGNCPVMHIRKVAKKKLDMDYLLSAKMLPIQVRDYLIDKTKSGKCVVFGGPPGCVDRETEYFNGIEWKSIANYQEGEQVLQFNTYTGEASLVTPLRYIKEPCNKMYHFETKYGINQTLSPEHRVLYYKRRKKNRKKYWDSEVQEISAEELKDLQNSGKFYGGFKTDFVYNGPGMNLSDVELKLMLAVICDGSFPKKNSNSTYCRINLKKQRKKDALESILKEWGKEYVKTNNDDGYSVYTFKAPRKEKEFTSEWYSCSQHQLQLICNNVLQWDGSCDSHGRKSFETTSKQSADFIQFAFSACGYRATFYCSHRAGTPYQTNNKTYVRKHESFSVIISNKNITGMAWHNDGRDNNVLLEEVVPEDGFKYCFSVPTHALVLRRNGKIFITGNSGKSTLLNAWIEFLPKYEECLCIQENDELFTEQRGWIFKTPDITYDDNGIPHGVTLEALGQMALVEGCNRFIIGEVKGGEMRSCVTLLNSGCKAALTMHANSARQMLNKLADLVSAGSGFPLETSKSMISEIDVLVYMEGFKIVEILENKGYNREIDDFEYKPIYKLNKN